MERLDALVMAAWLLSGSLGAVNLWALDKHLNHDDEWCPTPRAILFFICMSVFGPIILGTSCLIWAMGMFDMKDSWFTRPICKKKEDD